MCNFLPFHSNFCWSSGQTSSKKIHFRCRLDRKKVSKFLHSTLSYMKTMEDCRSIFSMLVKVSLHFLRFNLETATHFSENLGQKRQILFPKSANFSLHSAKLTSNPTLPPSKKVIAEPQIVKFRPPQANQLLRFGAIHRIYTPIILLFFLIKPKYSCASCGKKYGAESFTRLIKTTSTKAYLTPLPGDIHRYTPTSQQKKQDTAQQNFSALTFTIAPIKKRFRKIFRNPHIDTLYIRCDYAMWAATKSPTSVVE